MSKMICTEVKGPNGEVIAHEHPVVNFGTKEWIAFWALMITIGGVLIRYEHRSTATEMTATAAVQAAAAANTTAEATAKGMGERMGSIDRKIDLLNQNYSEASQERAKMMEMIKGSDGRLQRIENNQDRAARKES